ncbi:MAG: aldose 1-epimerase family protein [Planctomycetaceae bacterium]|nr:aldose 1-epimerase family protein [Planctomycetaceae bacterium]
MNLHTIKNDRLQVVISPRGAEIQSIYDLRTQTEFLWQGDACFWADRSPLLFPIIGRLRNDVYSYGGKDWPMESPHGFIKSQVFQPESIKADSIRLFAESTRKTMLQYPFAFRFSVEYRLVGAEWNTSFQIRNEHDRPMPFSLGTHPGFNIPLSPGEPFEEYGLLFDEEENPHRVELAGVLLAGKTSSFALQSNRRLPLRHGLFDDEAVILGGIQHKTVSLVDPNGIMRWSMHFDDFDYLTLWQPPQTRAPFVCLECWNGLPDPGNADSNALDQKPGMRLLAPGETECFSLKVTLF